MLEAGTILLAEDDENDVELMRRAFRKAGILNPLQVVNDGEAAVEYLIGTVTNLSRAVPRLLLLDLKMPKKNGFEVLAWLRSHPHLKRLPVVVLTSSKEHRDVDLAYELGANSYLVKPPDFRDLVEMMKSLGSYWFGMNQIPELAVYSVA